MPTQPTRVALALLVAPAIVLSAVAFARLHNRPFDFSAATSSRGIELPDWLTGLKRYDGIPFWAHTSLGVVLLMTDASPTAAATQWAKAGSHASRPVEVRIAARGVQASATRFDSSGDAARFFCRFSRNDVTRRLIQVIDRATLECPTS